MVYSYSVRKGMGAGAIGGVIAGVVMLAAMMSTMAQMGFPPLAFQIMTGMMMGQGMATAATVGISLHLIASTLIGIIFGGVVSTGKLRLTGFGKGIGLGIATGIIAFAVLFLPMMFTVLPPQMMGLMHMMNPQAPTSMIMQKIQASMSMIIGGSVFVHFVYGIVLGAVTTGIVRRTRSFECRSCHMKFKDEEEMGHHMEQQHSQMH